MTDELPSVRIDDAERDRAVAFLRHHLGEGRITLDEFSDRVGHVYAALTSSEIDVDLEGVAVFGDKRCTTGSTPPVPGSPVVLVRAFAVFGDVRVRSPLARGDRRFGRSRPRPGGR